MSDKRTIFDGVPVSGRVYHALSALGLDRWAEVATMSPLVFLRHPHCGVVTFRELQSHVARQAGPLQNDWTLIAPRGVGQTRP